MELRDAAGLFWWFRQPSIWLYCCRHRGCTMAGRCWYLQLWFLQTLPEYLHWLNRFSIVVCDYSSVIHFLYRYPGNDLPFVDTLMVNWDGRNTFHFDFEESNRIFLILVFAKIRHYFHITFPSLPFRIIDIKCITTLTIDRYMDRYRGIWNHSEIE